jgi:hypothetical protein
MALLGEETTEGDNAIDILFGGLGRDWFLLGFRDSTHDRRHDERLG